MPGDGFARGLVGQRLKRPKAKVARHRNHQRSTCPEVVLARGLEEHMSDVIMASKRQKEKGKEGQLMELGEVRIRCVRRGVGGLD